MVMRTGRVMIQDICPGIICPGTSVTKVLFRLYAYLEKVTGSRHIMIPDKKMHIGPCILQL